VADTGTMLDAVGAIFTGPAAGLSIEPFRLDPPGPGEVLVAMVASGICRSDLHVVDGEWRRPGNVILGHEGAGIVQGVGPGVTSPEVGDLVVLAWTAPCGVCRSCRRGEPWLCLRPRGGGHRLADAQVRARRFDGSALGVYSGVGTHASHQVVDAAAAVSVDPRTPHDVAALIGCAATTGIGAVRNTARVAAGESTVVIGLGGVGLSALMAALDAGAAPVVAIDSQPDKTALASELGATLALPPDNAPEAVRELTGGGADHVFEAIGRVDTAELALTCVRPGGSVTLVGMTAQADRIRIDGYRFVEDGIRLLGSNYGSAVPARDFPRVATDVVTGRLPLTRLVTEHIDLGGIDTALEAMRRRHGARRVVTFEPIA
jgi:S-(hydroxymethyl)glutathione dehydrogenase/alcohol dehydrogenase